jgi:hypothetical protein
LIGLLILIASPAQADVWMCAQKDGSLLYTDQPGPGCKEIRSDSPYTTLQREEAAKGHDAAAQPTVKALLNAAVKSHDAVSHVFAAARRAVPSLLVSDLPDSVKAKGFYAPNRGDIVLVELDVSHFNTGAGPAISADGHFQPDAVSALRRSVYAAAQAIGYDPKYLQVKLSIPTAPLFDHGYQVDGPSASVGWAVAVASSVLGDPLRSDVCLTGTMNESLDVGRVGGIEYKIDGCHKLGFRELIFPAGQGSFDLDVKRQSYSMKLTQVSTLAEAYEAATGQPLRRAGR